ncbi:hypothetical protein BDV96DRAFT_596976 [Lophiotrema nucula]|uniref:SRR1-like domain-containing protein n=1 Tax=Lophiotrema nucula TaxID=690887 RepID=A0A6A5ZGR5_9PLEO|nr:hypothetical protein BDV96DRAFT_596976 [Lophiotrema nucula]
MSDGSLMPIRSLSSMQAPPVLHLESLYVSAGIPMTQRIEIIAQDPAYTPLDETLLSQLSTTHPITVLNDPDALLAINDSTLVMSCYATFPIKQIVADLAAESPSSCPAGILWNMLVFGEDVDKWYGVDKVRYPDSRMAHCTNSSSPRTVEMLKRFRKVFDGTVDSPVSQSEEEDNAYGLGALEDMEVWLREK